MTNDQKAGVFLGATLLFVVVCIAGLLGAFESDKKAVAKMSAAEPRVIQVKEVVGQVVGGPQIVAGNPLVGYAVYIEESKTWGALYADGCPPNLGNGTRVVMYRGEVESNWYTFLRLRYE